MTNSSPESTVAGNDKQKWRSNKLNQIHEGTEEKKKAVDENLLQEKI